MKALLNFLVLVGLGYLMYREAGAVTSVLVCTLYMCIGYEHTRIDDLKKLKGLDRRSNERHN